MRKQNKRKENYFSKNVRDYGPNFIDESKTAEVLSIEAPRIIKDMVLAKVQYEDYITYIVHPKMMAALLGYCNRKFQFHSICTESFKVSMNVWASNGIMITPEINNTFEINSTLTTCYATIIQTLNRVAVFPDPQELILMTSKIHQFANYIIKY